MRSIDTEGELYSDEVRLIGMRNDKHENRYNILIIVSNEVPDWILRELYGVSEVRARKSNEDFWDIDARAVDTH